MSRRETAYGQFRNVVVFIFPTEAMAQLFVIQLKAKDLLTKLGIKKPSPIRKG